MKEAKAIKKVPGGKLVRVDITYSERLERVKITGDFFLHPEDVLIIIEDALTGAQLPLDKSSLIEKVQSILEREKAVLVGFSPQDLIDILEEAVQS
jgi:lipoate-protein ligase A